MKLRTRAGSLRLRLGRAEVTRLADEGLVEEAVLVGPGPDDRLVYRLVASATHEGPLDARLAGGTLEIRVARSAARAWALGPDVGLASRRTLEGGGELHLLVEKDFACLVPRGEDDADAFPHPEAPAHPEASE